LPGWAPVCRYREHWEHSLSSADLIVVGGGPAGVTTGLLFARSGCRVIVLEKHADFFRDFRGDTVHPSTMEILHQLGMLERFLKRPHDRVHSAQIRVGENDYTIGDLSHLNTPAPFIAMMPQWEFLDFLRDEAEAFPGFRLELEAPVADFIEQAGRVVGVRLHDGRELRAKLVIAADGRSSIVRRKKMLPLETIGAPMDVFWFRIEKFDNAGEALRGSIDTGRMVVLIDRRTYWQCAFLIPKRAAEEVRSRGTDWVLAEVGKAFPDLQFPPDALRSVDDMHLLEVALDRLTSWSKPGLLAIGDAAHAMSPIGGIGINLAIQDAVAAANILAAPLRSGAAVDPLLPQVQNRRMLPTRIIQGGQKAAQERIVGRVLGGEPIRSAPLAVRLLNRFPRLRRIPGRIIGLGVRRERVRSPYDPAGGKTA
jgi:2-polyprenyl-6-methoxyphenol hydroxylase-like FAD-dependent oxidoreductase